MNKKLIPSMLGLLASLWIIGAVCARAQTTTGQVSGTVTDPTGAAVPQASVTITNVDTALTRKAETSETGTYVIPLLPPGNYKLTVEKQGFQRAQEPSLVLQVNQTLALDVALRVGAVTETVIVKAQAPQLQSTSSTLGAVITSRAVVDLPLNGRNFTQLLLLTPGAGPISTAQRAGIGATAHPLAPVGLPGSSFAEPSMNGQWNRANQYMIDGLNATTWLSNTYTTLPVVDGIQEFKVQSHNDSAEYGGVLGGTVNVATKAGTNSLHGSAWEFVRNDVFDARNPFTDARRNSPAPFRQNMFGFAVGGPVYLPKVYNGKDKTWFFFAYEGWRYRRPAQAFYRVPTAAELNGDFSATYATQRLFDPVTTRPDPNNPAASIRDPFVCDASGNPVAQGTAGATPCNKIPTDRLNPMTVGYMQALYDAPNLTGNVAFNFLNNFSNQNDNDTYIVKIDQRIGDRSTAWFRFSRMHDVISAPLGSKVTNTSDIPTSNFGGGVTHLFAPNLVLDARLGFNWYDGTVIIAPNAGRSVYDQLGFKGVERYGNAQLGFPGLWTVHGMVGPQDNREKSSNFSATLTWVRGRHSIKGGYQLIRPRFQCCALEPGYGVFNNYGFSNVQTADPAQSTTTGSAAASTLLGLPSNIALSEQAYDFNVLSYAPFIEDKWQVTPKLSLTLGLRYDYYHTPKLTNDVISMLDPVTGDWLIGGGKLPPACDVSGSAPCIPGDGNLSNIPNGEHIRVADNPNIGPAPVSTNFGPRLGMAWRPTEKTVVRAGYGLVYANLMGILQTFVSPIGRWPTATQITETFNAIGQPLTTIQELQAIALSPLPSATPWGESAFFYDPKIKNARSHQWNSGIQRQMTDSLMLSVAYVGSTTDRLNVSGQFNVSPTPGPGTPAEVNARRPFPWAAPTIMAFSIGSARYHSLQFSAEKRYSAGLQFLVAYTLSRATDNGGSGYYGVESGPGGFSSIQNLNDLEWAVSGYDIPHNLSAAVQYELPAGRGKRVLNSGPLSYILGDWQINTITRMRSGQPYNLVIFGDVANIGATPWFPFYARPNLVGDPHVPNPTAEKYYDPAAFEIPVNSYGNAPRNMLRSASVYSVDFSLFKKFRIKEDVALEFRAEAFNVFNIQNLGVPATFFNFPGPGRVNGVAVAPRQIQLGMKLSF